MYAFGMDSSDYDFLEKPKFDEDNERNMPDTMKPFYRNDIGFTSEFEAFQNVITDYILNQDYDNLYEVSDKTMEKEEFISYVKNSFGNDVEEICKRDKATRGITLAPLNQPILLLGGFEILAYLREVTENDENLTDDYSAYIKVYKSTLYFNYKDNSYKLMSVFKPLKEVETL